MSGRINPLNPLLGKIERYELSNQARLGFERARVKWTCSRLGLSALEKCLKLYDEMDFDGFNSHLSDYYANPLISRMKLGCYSAPADGSKKGKPETARLWFSFFHTLPFMDRFSELFEARSSDYDSVGLIFPRNGFSQGMIVHNGGIDRYITDGSAAHVVDGKLNARRASHRVRLVVQPYMGFIDAVKLEQE